MGSNIRYSNSTPVNTLKLPGTATYRPKPVIPANGSPDDSGTSADDLIRSIQGGADHGQDSNMYGTSARGSGVTGSGGSASSAASSSGGSIFGFGQGGKVGDNQNLGSRRLTNSSVNYSGLAGINSWLGNPNDPQYAQRASYLQGMGINPTVNGRSLYDLNRGTDIAGMNTLAPYTSSGTFGGMAGSPQNAQAQHDQDAFLNAQTFSHQNTDGNGQAMVQVLQPAYTDKNGNRHEAVYGDSTGRGFTGQSNGQTYANGALVDRGGGAGAGVSGYNPSAGLAGIAGGGDLGNDYGAGSAYARLIANGGSMLTPEQTAALRHRTTGAVARGTNDALEAARVNALRRGDFSGSTLGSREDQIMRAGASDVASAGLKFDTGQQQQNMQNLLAALGGAGGLYGQNLQNAASLRQLELLAGQLQGQGALGGSQAGLQYILGGK